ncbi:hypothetical protein [Microcoleus sp. Pol10D4]|uniref:hypothetical protein n=1 Tax=Microcoleus sp. Pol10D4 TaxID=3055387 RepID=UPI002FD1C1B9
MLKLYNFSLKAFGFQVFTTDKEIRPTSAECGVELHRYLIDAERDRLRADYNFDPNITETDAEQLISRTEYFLNFVIANRPLAK